LLQNVVLPPPFCSVILPRAPAVAVNVLWSVVYAALRMGSPSAAKSLLPDSGAVIATVILLWLPAAIVLVMGAAAGLAWLCATQRHDRLQMAARTRESLLESLGHALAANPVRQYRNQLTLLLAALEVSFLRAVFWLACVVACLLAGLGYCLSRALLITLQISAPLPRTALFALIAAWFDGAPLSSLILPSGQANVPMWSPTEQPPARSPLSAVAAPAINSPATITLALCIALQLALMASLLVLARRLQDWWDVDEELAGLPADRDGQPSQSSRRVRGRSAWSARDDADKADEEMRQLEQEALLYAVPLTLEKVNDGLYRRTQADKAGREIGLQIVTNPLHEVASVQQALGRRARLWLPLLPSYLSPRQAGGGLPSGGSAVPAHGGELHPPVASVVSGKVKLFKAPDSTKSAGTASTTSFYRSYIPRLLSPLMHWPGSRQSDDTANRRELSEAMPSPPFPGGTYASGSRSASSQDTRASRGSSAITTHSISSRGTHMDASVAEPPGNLAAALRDHTAEHAAQHVYPLADARPSSERASSSGGAVPLTPGRASIVAGYRVPGASASDSPGRQRPPRRSLLTALRPQPRRGSGTTSVGGGELPAAPETAVGGIVQASLRPGVALPRLDIASPNHESGLRAAATPDTSGAGAPTSSQSSHHTDQQSTGTACSCTSCVRAGGGRPSSCSTCTGSGSYTGSCTCTACLHAPLPQSTSTAVLPEDSISSPRLAQMRALVRAARRAGGTGRTIPHLADGTGAASGPAVVLTNPMRGAQRWQRASLTSTRPPHATLGAMAGSTPPHRDASLSTTGATPSNTLLPGGICSPPPVPASRPVEPRVPLVVGVADGAATPSLGAVTGIESPSGGGRSSPRRAARDGRPMEPATETGLRSPRHLRLLTLGSTLISPLASARAALAGARAPRSRDSRSSNEEAPASRAHGAGMAVDISAAGPAAAVGSASIAAVPDWTSVAASTAVVPPSPVAHGRQPHAPGRGGSVAATGAAASGAVPVSGKALAPTPWIAAAAAAELASAVGVPASVVAAHLAASLAGSGFSPRGGPSHSPLRSSCTHPSGAPSPHTGVSVVGLLPHAGGVDELPAIVTTLKRMKRSLSESALRLPTPLSSGASGTAGCGLVPATDLAGEADYLRGGDGGVTPLPRRARAPCNICFEDPGDAVFMECGHAGICGPCARIIVEGAASGDGGENTVGGSGICPMVS